MSYVDEIYERVVAKNPGEAEFHQAVKEVLDSLKLVIDANEAEYRKISTKKMDLKWQSPDADMKTKVLGRVNYAAIFTPEDTEVVDTYNREELIKKLKIASVEKGKQVYISSKTQSIFVSNQAHATTIPVSKLNEAGDIRIHNSLVMTQSLAKSVIDILSKTSAEDVQIYSREKTCNIFVEGENEKVGIWFEMPPASKVHVTAVDRYNSLGYATYHTAFRKDFIKDIVRSASASSKDSKVEIMFVPTADGEESPFDLVINGGSASKSTKDLYSVNAEYVAGDTEKLLAEKFVINLELLVTMLSPLETDLVALDFEVATDDSKCIRVAEIDIDELNKAYDDARKETQRICEESGVEFKATETPTPLDVKMQYMRREGVLKTKQYTTLLK